MEPSDVEMSSGHINIVNKLTALPCQGFDLLGLNATVTVGILRTCRKNI